jgi:hypothetical protein
VDTSLVCESTETCDITLSLLASHFISHVCGWDELIKWDVDLYALCHKIFDLFELVQLVFSLDVGGTANSIRKFPEDRVCGSAYSATIILAIRPPSGVIPLRSPIPSTLVSTCVAVLYVSRAMLERLDGFSILLYEVTYLQLPMRRKRLQ